MEVIHIGSMQVSDLTTLWAGYLEFEGRRYVNSLSTSPSPSASARLFAFDREVSVNIFIATDVFGVRDIIVAPLSELPMIDRESGVGWNIYRQKVIPFLIMGDFDGLKLRRLAIVNTPDEYSEHCEQPNVSLNPYARYPRKFHSIRWPVIPKTFETLSPPMIPIDRIDKSHIVRAIDWNLPGIKGYTFHGKGAMLIDVFPHHPGQKFPYDIGSCCFEHYWWIYMPIDPGERVADLWVRDAVTAKSLFSGAWKL